MFYTRAILLPSNQQQTLHSPNASSHLPCPRTQPRAHNSSCILKKTIKHGSIRSLRRPHSGQILILNVEAEHDACPKVIHAETRQLCTRTLLCTLTVDISDQNQPQSSPTTTAFLKLFDRCFAEQLRRDNGIDPWTGEMEQAYIQSVESGAIIPFLRDLHIVPNFQDDTEEDWDDAQNEAFLADEHLRLHKTEVTAYRRMHGQQGRTIPRLLAPVSLVLRAGSDAIKPKIENDGLVDFEPFKLKGILLEYINRFSLSDMVDHAPQSNWQAIVDQEVTAVRLLRDYDILNRDVRPDNFIITSAPDFQVFMLDFALCRFRGEEQSDLEWGKAKKTKDEEGAVGLVMRKRLGKHGFELEYESSGRDSRWADTDDSFPEGDKEGDTVGCICVCPARIFRYEKDGQSHKCGGNILY